MDTIRYSNETGYTSEDMKNKRGLTVYSMSDIQQVTGRDAEGRLVSWGVETPYFYITIQQREEIFRLCSPVFGLISSRMNRMAGLKYNIVSERYKEDEIAEELKDLKSLYDEYDDPNNLGHMSTRSEVYKEIKKYLPDVKLDLSNFHSALLRWKKQIKRIEHSLTERAYEWLQEPSYGELWESFVKEWTQSFLVHGASAIYKDWEGDSLENFGMLPAGTVYKFKSPYFTNRAGYVQVVPGYTEAKVYETKEISYIDYLPVSSRNYGMIPLEALIKKVTESLLFDDKMANEADGSRPPEKLVIVTENNPFGSLDETEKQDVPLDANKQKRIEQKLKERVQGGVMTFSGNNVEVVDMSRADTMATQMQRQKDIREEVAVVFNATNMEMNLTGSENTSGRSTSQAQLEIEQGKGIAPIAKTFSSIINKTLLPFKFGTGLVFEFEMGKNEIEEKQLDKMKLETGELTPNELREKYGKEGFGDKGDQMHGSQSEQGQDEINPLYMRNV